jgi:hypothetical protein
MKEVKIELTDEDYDLLKQIDFSEAKDGVFFNDNTKEFRTTSELADIIFEEYINMHAFDSSYHVTEYGKKLYRLYDLIFFSEEA